MDKAKAIEYLNSQKSKIDLPDFDLDSWAGAIAGFLDGMIGRGNNYSAQLRALGHDYIMSHEELYPKKVIDVEKSKHKFANLISEIIDQIGFLDDTDFEQKATQEESETLKTVINALRNSLTGKQIGELREIAKKYKGKQRTEMLLDHVRNYNIDITQNILVEILSSKEIWEKMG